MFFQIQILGVPELLRSSRRKGALIRKYIKHTRVDTRARNASVTWANNNLSSILGTVVDGFKGIVTSILVSL